MLEVRCASCDVLLQFEDEMGGRTIPCPDCRYPVAIPKQEYVHRAGHCLTCDRDQPTRPSFLRVSQIGSTGLATVERYIFIRCFFCDECYQRVNWLYYLRFFVIFGAIGLAVLACLIGIPVLSSPEMETRKGSALHTSAVLIFLALPMVVVFPAGFVWLAYAIPRKMSKLLSPAANNYLLSLRVITDWGIRHRLIAYRSLPWGQTSLN